MRDNCDNKEDHRAPRKSQRLSCAVLCKWDRNATASKCAEHGWTLRPNLSSLRNGQGNGTECRQSTKRGDERRDPTKDNQHTIQRASSSTGKDSDQCAGNHCTWFAPARFDKRVHGGSADSSGKHHHAADREINPCGNNDQRHAHSKDANGGILIEQVAKVLNAEEVTALLECAYCKEQHKCHQHSPVFKKALHAHGRSGV